MMKTQTKAALAAKAIKSELSKAYPLIKFSVKSENFAGGDAVSIAYIDGPITEDIDKIVSKYQYGKFNSMEDIYEYTNTNADIPQAKWVQVDRSMSEATKEVILNQIRADHRNDTLQYKDYFENMGEYVSTLVRRAFYKLSF